MKANRKAPPRFVLWSVVALAAALPNCNCDDDLEQLTPDVVVTPESIDFGFQGVGRGADAAYQVGNRGSAPLTVEDVSIEALDNAEGDFIDSAGAAFSIVEPPDEVEPNGSVEGIVRFTPTSQGRFGGTLVIKTDDRDTPEWRVPLVGEGGSPEIEAVPATLDFGIVNEGPGSMRLLTLTNVGKDVLHIRDIKLESAPGASVFSLPDDLETELSLNIDQSTTVEVRMDPTAEAVEAAMGLPLDDAVIVESDATNAPNLRVPLTGEANLAPRVVAVELETRLPEVKVGFGREVVIDGSDTEDPEGDTFTYDWSLVETPDPDAILFSAVPGDDCTLDSECDVDQGYRCVANSSGNGSRCRQAAWTRIVPNAAGTYVIRLRATDEHGAWGEADARILPRDFAVVLTWAPEPGSICTQYTEEECDALPPQQQFCPCGQSDLDLHLIRPIAPEDPPEAGLGDYGTCPAGCEEVITPDGGTPTLVNYCAEDSDDNVDTCRQMGSDCSYANRYPEWGNVGRLDDPRLDVDDVRGDGPEVITLNNPMDGTYTTAVHYCNDRINNEPTYAYLDIYVKGELAESLGPQAINEGEVWYAASMARTGGPADGTWAITPLAPVVTQIGTDLCNQ